MGTAVADVVHSSLRCLPRLVVTWMISRADSSRPAISWTNLLHPPICLGSETRCRRAMQGRQIADSRHTAPCSKQYCLSRFGPAICLCPASWACPWLHCLTPGYQERFPVVAVVEIRHGSRQIPKWPDFGMPAAVPESQSLGDGNLSQGLVETLCPASSTSSLSVFTRHVRPRVVDLG